MKNLTSLLQTKFSLDGDGLQGPFGKPVDVTADFVTKTVGDFVQNAAAKNVTTATIAASAVSKFFTACLQGQPADVQYFQKLENVRTALSQLVVHVLADYYSVFLNTASQDTLIAAAMQQAERPYPRLNDPKGDTNGSGATQ